MAAMEPICPAVTLAPALPSGETVSKLLSSLLGLHVGKKDVLRLLYGVVIRATGSWKGDSVHSQLSVLARMPKGNFPATQAGCCWLWDLLAKAAIQGPASEEAGRLHGDRGAFFP